jgi:hypothetical protein
MHARMKQSNSCCMYTCDKVMNLLEIPETRKKYTTIKDNLSSFFYLFCMIDRFRKRGKGWLQRGIYLV